MKPTTAFLLIVSAVALVACGKSEEAAAPEPAVAEAPTLEVPATPPTDTAAADAVVETTPVETPTPATKPAAIEAPAPTASSALTASMPAALEAVSPPSVADLVHGQSIYRQACAFCHDKGVAGAPRTGDAIAWNARIAQGMDTLYVVAIKGKGAMPAKGGNPALSETDVRAAVDFMVAQSR